MPNIYPYRALCALLVTGALVAFTGCGGDDNKDNNSSGSATTTTTPADTGGNSGGGDIASYKAGAEKAANDFRDSAQAASQKISTASTPSAKIDALDGLKDSVNQAADDFSALNPPANLKSDNDKLVSEFRDLASTVDQVKSALKTNDTAKAQDALTKLGKSQTDIATTISSIQSKLAGQ